MVEVQDFVPRGLISQLRYPLAPKFADTRGALSSAVMEEVELELPNWGWSEEQVHLGSADLATAFFITSQDARAQFEKLIDVEVAVSLTRTFLSAVLRILDIETVTFIGVRSYWAGAVDSFEALRDRMVGSLAPYASAFSNALGGRPTDVGWVFEYRGDDPKHVMRFGPMGRDQAVGRYVSPDHKDALPPASLFLDLDRVYSATEVEAGQAIDRWEQSLRKAIEHGERIGHILTTSVDARD